MATDLEKLVVQLSADIKGFDKELAKAVGISNKQFNAVERRARQMNKNLDGIFAKSFKGLATPLAGVGAALGINELRKMTDTWTDMTSRVDLATGSQEKGVEVMDRLGDMARRTYSDLTLTAESYLANSTALKELGYSTDQSLDYTEALNNALVVSGAKGEKAARVQDALAKAMGLGKLSGDNLNTVLASGGRVAEALAAGLGTTVGGLRKLGQEGKITGRALVDALSGQMEVLRKEAAAMPATIGDGFTLLNNALLQYVGKADSAAGVSAKISEALIIIADNFDKVADAGLQVAAVFAAGLLGRSIGTMIKSLGLGATALRSFGSALLAARSMGGVATAIGGIGAAAGPVGAIIGGAVVASLILYNNTVGQSSEASEVYAAALKEVRDAAKDTGDAVEEAGGKIARGLPQKIEGGIELSLEEIEAATRRVVDQFDNLRNVSFEGVPQSEVDKVKDLGDQFSTGSITAQKLATELDGITRANPVWENFTSSVEGFIQKLQEAEKATRLLQARLADLRSDSGRSAKDDEVKIDLNGIAAGTYEKEALRRAALGKSQLTLETEIGKVRNDALKEGITLTEQQIATIAKANIAGNESRSGEGKKPKKEKKEKDSDYERLTKSITDRTAAMVAETEAQRGINPLIDDYEYAIEKARATQELLNAAQKAGVEITPEMRKEIAATAEQWALATVEANKLAEAQDKIRQNAEEMAEFQKDLTRGIVDGFIQGKKAADVFADALSKIGNKLLDLAFNGLFDTKGGGGGLLGGIGKLFGFADGGLPQFANGTPSRLRPGIIRGPGTGRSDSILARVSNTEFITNARSTAKHRGLLEAINEDRLPAYMDGTPSLRAPMMPILKAGNTNEQGGMRFAPVYHIDARGADQAAVDRLQRGLEKTNREMESRVVQTVRKAQKSNWKFG